MRWFKSSRPCHFQEFIRHVMDIFTFSVNAIGPDAHLSANNPYASTSSACHAGSCSMATFCPDQSWPFFGTRGCVAGKCCSYARQTRST